MNFIIVGLCLFDSEDQQSQQFQIQMIDQDQIFSGLSHYEKHEYLPALKQFTKGASKSTSEVSQMIFQSLQAITNMQLCNYNRAAQQFNDLRVKLEQWEAHPTQASRAAQVELLKVKVLANLLIIHLINCSKQVESVLEDLISILLDHYSRNKVFGSSLFKAVLKSLFGFQTFNQMQSELISVLTRVDKAENPLNKLNRDGNALLPSPIFLSSLSMFSHLTGNANDAIRLEKIAYQMTQNDNPVAAVISLRHLQQLQKERGNEKQRRNYHQQLMILMGNEELEGIAEETLFRNYSMKIDSAFKIIQQLVELEKQLTVDHHQYPSHYAVLWKLRSIKTVENEQKINAVIQMLKNDETVLNIMTETEFVNEALEEYHNRAFSFFQNLQKHLLRYFFNRINAYSNSRGRSQKSSRVIDVNIIKPNQNVSNEDEESQQKPMTPNHTKKHTFASTLHLPQKNVSVFRSEANRLEVGNNSPSPLSSSRLEVKPAIESKISNRNQVYLQEEKPKYKIGKEDQKKVSKHEKREGRDRSKTEYPSKHEKDSLQNNPIREFMRDIVPAKEVVNQPPTRLPVRQIERQKIELVQQKQQVKIPILSTGKSEIKVPKPPINPLPPVTNPPERPAEIKKTESSQFNSVLQMGSGKNMVPKSFVKDNYQERLVTKLRKCINLCISGQYIEKRHFSSDGGAQRFLRLGPHKDKLFWGQDQDHYDQSSYNIEDIKGIVFGKITETMLKESNKKLQPWKCFSLIMKKRTFDVYCPQEKDLKFWIPGLSLFLKDFKYDSPKYMLKLSSSNKKVEKHVHKSIILGDNVIPRYYSTGRILWKKFLMRMQWEYLNIKKKDKRNIYSNANAFAIVVGAVRVLKYVPTKIKRNIE